jgi:phosphoribosylamine--glycine ligase
MNILILGAGGREHTLAWKLKQSKKLSQLFVAPGNAGTAALAINLKIGVNDFEAIKNAVITHKINMVIVGPEDPLVNGIHDFFLNDADLKAIPVIGPQKAAATLEGSKDFAKEFMMRHNIPTAAYQSFTAESLEKGFQFLESRRISGWKRCRYSERFTRS